MNRGLDERLESTPSTEELLHVDTAFLDAFRQDDREKLTRSRTDPQGSPLAVGTNAGATGLNRDPGQSAEPDGVKSVREAGLWNRPDLAAGPGVSYATHPPVSGGASPGSVADNATAIPPLAARPDDTVVVMTSAGADVRPPSAPEHVPDRRAGSLQHTDHQDAVQNGAASTKRGSTGSGGGAALPQSGFKLSGVASQPAVRALPGAVLGALREQLRSAAVRELSVSDRMAREFSERLSQASLVTAFLSAQLDLRIDADVSTQLAADLFRSRDPLLGSVAVRLDNLERLESERRSLLGDVRGELAGLRQTVAVIEQVAAYLIADRSENFLRGSHNVRDVPITHPNAIFIRDKARDATNKQTRLEQEQEGRPIR
ncbi:hypothetical protein ACIQUM_07450 [Amycolatopsis azurea]|uniref:hypothetical protein n=1 Tax=Amycolatopsis azurea TaxID=36819 RepID=UPI0037F8CB89